MSRYTVTRGHFGNPVIYDQVERRPVFVGMRHPERDPRVADTESMQQAEVCARALNDVERAQVWGKS